MSKLSVVAALSAVLVAGSAHAADETVAPTLPANLASGKMIAGGILLGVGTASAVAATVTGTVGVLEGFCGLGADPCSDSSVRQSDDMTKAAIGFGVLAAVTMAFGIPLVVSARNEARTKSLTFGVAPSVGSQGGGLNASLAMHF